MLPVLLFGLVEIFNVNATELYYYDPPRDERQDLEYRIRGAGSIPMELGEKVVSLDSQRRSGTNAVIVLINKEFSVTGNHLKDLVKGTLGIMVESENRSGPISKDPPPQYPIPSDPAKVDEWEVPSIWPPLGDGLSKLKQKKNPPEIPRELQLTSKPYNTRQNVYGYSQVRIRISDGSLLLGKPVTILQVRRRDFSEVRARLGHTPFPLPYKEKRKFILVTDKEVALIERLKERLPGAVIRYFLPHVTTHYDEAMYPPLLASMEEAVKQFPK